MSLHHSVIRLLPCDQSLTVLCRLWVVAPHANRMAGAAEIFSFAAESRCYTFLNTLITWSSCRLHRTSNYSNFITCTATNGLKFTFTVKLRFLNIKTTVPPVAALQSEALVQPLLLPPVVWDSRFVFSDNKTGNGAGLLKFYTTDLLVGSIITNTPLDFRCFCIQ